MSSTQVTLSEKIGAMALVDELRHKEMQVIDHLNLPVRKAEIARQIKSYYESRGIEVTPNMIDAGVTLYFQDRLKYEAPAISPLTAKLANLYITRGQWRNKALVGLTFLALTGALVLGGLEYRAQGEKKSLQKAEQYAQDLHSRVSQLHQAGLKLLERGKVAVANDPLPSASLILEREAQVLVVAESALGQVHSATKDANQVQKITQANKTGDAFRVLESQLSKTNAVLAEIPALLQAKQELARIQESGLFKKQRVKYPSVAKGEATAVAGIENAHQHGISVAITSVGALRNSLAELGKSDLLEAGLTEIIGQFKDMGIPEDTPELMALQAQMDQAIGSLKFREAEQVLHGARNLLEFARVPVTLTIVNKSGVKSGVERVYKQSQGKAWYLIVESLDQAGKPVPMTVKSAESGKIVTTSLFGLRVSEAEYNKIRKQKKATGHIEDRVMGLKKTKSLQVQYTRLYGVTPEIILEW